MIPEKSAFNHFWFLNYCIIKNLWFVCIFMLNQRENQNKRHLVYFLDTTLFTLEAYKFGNTKAKELFKISSFLFSFKNIYRGNVPLIVKLN